MVDEPFRQPVAADGRLLENLAHFVRALRRAGLPLGPGHALRAAEALQAINVSDRRQFYWALHATLVAGPEKREMFDQAFHMFWRSPDFLERMMGMLLPSIKVDADENAKPPPPQRLADAFAPEAAEMPAVPQQQEIEVDMRLVWSDQEALKSIDFETMSAAEAEAAKRAITRLTLPLQDLPTRRFRPDQRGRRADMRATLRAQLRAGPGIIPLARKAPRVRPPPLVALCDISGSMARYSRMLLHFLHALATARDRVHSFVFGTRLTNISRQLKNRDVDLALDRVAATVEDWEGGTRIGACLHDFNRNWSRRVLGQGAVVLLITDGLDRQHDEGLAKEAERLGKSCRRLVWLNPLLRYDGFEPKATGVRAILPHVDEFRATHNLESLEALAMALSGPIKGGGHQRWQTSI
jgi:uncharacterized protein with von Willebrand factor type A (vWA) domain